MCEMIQILEENFFGFFVIGRSIIPNSGPATKNFFVASLNNWSIYKLFLKTNVL